MLRTIVTYLTQWTPLSVAFLLVFIVALFGLSIMLLLNKAAVSAWIDARAKEGSTQHGYNVAITTTSYWLLDLAGMLPQGEHISFRLVELGWVGALALFIYPSSASKLPWGSGSSQSQTKP